MSEAAYVLEIRLDGQDQWTVWDVFSRPEPIMAHMENIIRGANDIAEARAVKVTDARIIIAERKRA